MIENRFRFELLEFLQRGELELLKLLKIRFRCFINEQY